MALTTADEARSLLDRLRDDPALLAVAGAWEGDEKRTPLAAISIVTDPSMGEPAKHGLEKVIAALQEKQVSFEQIHSLDAARGKILADFLNWMVTDGQKMTTTLTYAPLPENVVAKVKEAIKQIK